MSNQEFLLSKEDLSDFEIVKRHTLEFLSESTETLSSSSSNSEEFQQIFRIRVPKQGDSESGTSTVLKEENEDEEDGFKTPTSLDHKISVPSQCPPAPRKTKPSLKRKASYYNNHCNCKYPLDLSKEVFELLFPTQQHVSPLSTSPQSSKKVRRHEHK
ncbi:cyclin-dependent protein kinase inhibitor SMR3 [Cajanus cajan]|nr:cyclin-dependent protein kinase inhibitor SMR3 [Cajanus cajan]